MDEISFFLGQTHFPLFCPKNENANFAIHIVHSKVFSRIFGPVFIIIIFFRQPI